ncbi:TetR/AcrR family transcriptional regulator [Leptospira sp. 96542]|nr:TetR/AcrR family transcriptional regulator [Leptospira sp. 96542]
MRKSPRERILLVAKDKFYRQGYFHTGINEIIKESKTAKATFYDHYPSKTILGVKVVRAYAAETLYWFRSLLVGTESPSQFIDRLWIEVQKQTEETKEGYQGCPVAIFSCQFPVGENPFSDEFKSVIKRWEDLIIFHSERWIKKGHLHKNTNRRVFAQDVINLYEGALINWRLSLDTSYIQRMYEELKLKVKRESKR